MKISSKTMSSYTLAPETFFLSLDMLPIVNRTYPYYVVYIKPIIKNMNTTFKKNECLNK